VEKEIPAYIIYEDADVLSFLDISQVTKGHTLVIPKKHVQNIYALTEAESNPLFKAIPKIAKALKDAFNPIGLNMINNNDQPLQSVFHFHVHLIPRYENDGMYVGLDKDLNAVNHPELEAVHAQIKVPT
jgi:histidine triad (HIT) family protein